MGESNNVEQKGTREKVHLWLKTLIPLGLVGVLLGIWGKPIFSVLAPFIVAFLFAYIFNPIVTWIEGRNRKDYGMRRILAVFVLYLGFGALLIAFCLILALAAKDLVLLVQHLPQYGFKFYQLIEKYVLDRWGEIPPEVIQWLQLQMDPENLKTLLSEYIIPRLQEANLAGGVGTAFQGIGGFVESSFGLVITGATYIIGSAGNIFTFVSSAVLTLVIAFYLLLDYERFLRRITDLIPDVYRKDTVRIITRIDLLLSGFLRGQMVICMIMGGMVSIGLWLIGVDYALLIGLLAGLFNLIPYLGPVMGALPALILTGLETYQAQNTDWGDMAFSLGRVVLVFIIVQMLDGFLISPKIMGDRLNLHPMVILFALMLGGALFGLVGMLVAVPIACVVRVLIEEIYFPDPNRPIQ